MKKVKNVKKMVVNGLSKINKGFAVLGDMETAYQLVLMYSMLFGFDLYMPTLAIVLGSWFGYIGYVTDVSEITLKRNLGQDVTIEADDYRKEMVVVMGLTFVEFWTMWTGELTGEGVVLLFGYIAIQMLIVMMGMVLKDQIARLIAEKIVMEFLSNLVKQSVESIAKWLFKLLERITAKRAIEKGSKGFKVYNETRKIRNFLRDVYETIMSVPLIDIFNGYSAVVPILKGTSNSVSIGSKAHKRLDKEEGIVPEKTPFKKKVRKFFLKRWSVIGLAVIRFLKIAAGSAFGWKFLGLMLFYISAHLLIDFIKKAPIMICMWLAVEIVFFPPVRKQINRFSNKVDKWIQTRNDSENMAV